jgi:hypothetical protein
MQGAISTIEAIERWFRANEAPFFTLSYYSSSSATGQGQVVIRNQKDVDMDSAWNKLRSAIIDQTGFGRAQLNLIVYNKPEAYNTPAGRTNIDLVANQMPQMAGIGALPAVGSGFISESDFTRRLNEEREKWNMKQEIEALRDQVNNPANDWMAGIERFVASPLGIALISKFTGTPAGALMSAPINGPAPADDENLPDTDDVENELDNLDAIARANGMTLKEFLHKTASLAKQQPGVVAMLAQQ